MARCSKCKRSKEIVGTLYKHKGAVLCQDCLPNYHSNKINRVIDFKSLFKR